MRRTRGMGRGRGGRSVGNLMELSVDRGGMGLKSGRQNARRYNLYFV